jgi:hypothetical protein
MDWLLHIRAEWDTIVKAPFLLILILLLGAFFGWFAAHALYEQDLQTLRDQNAFLQNKVKQPEPTVMASAMASPTVNPTLTVPLHSNPFAGPDAKRQYLISMNPAMGWPKGKTNLKSISGAHYIGGSVPLDGYVYYDTTFENVQFIYEGKLPSGGWVDSQFNGVVGFNSNNPAIKTAVIIMQSLNFIPPSQISGCGLAPAPPELLVK